MANNNPAVAAIEYALNTDGDGLAFLRCWLHGEFPEIREEWPDAPQEVFIGADPLHPETKIGLEHDLRRVYADVLELNERCPMKTEIDRIKQGELSSCATSMLNVANNIENGDYWPTVK